MTCKVMISLYLGATINYKVVSVETTEVATPNKQNENKNFRSISDFLPVQENHSLKMQRQPKILLTAPSVF